MLGHRWAFSPELLGVRTPPVLAGFFRTVFWGKFGNSLQLFHDMLGDFFFFFKALE